MSVHLCSCLYESMCRAAQGGSGRRSARYISNVCHDSNVNRAVRCLSGHTVNNTSSGRKLERVMDWDWVQYTAVRTPMAQGWVHSSGRLPLSLRCG